MSSLKSVSTPQYRESLLSPDLSPSGMFYTHTVCICVCRGEGGLSFVN